VFFWGGGYLTLWSRGLLEKLLVAQLLKKFPDLYGTRRFITVFVSHAKWVAGHHGKARRGDADDAQTRPEAAKVLNKQAVVDSPEEENKI
jgi:hypothetical protein